MSYELLRGLYLGQESNADLTSTVDRHLLHIPTSLDVFIPAQLRAGRDVVLTGNPGDGKSHLVRMLQDLDRIDGVAVELDLSARDSQDLVGEWVQHRLAGRALLLCANEGPLTDMLAHLEATPELKEVAAELRGQLGRLVASAPEQLPPEPRHAVLIDLADRNLLSEEMIGSALRRVCDEQFLPPGLEVYDTSAGQNLMLLKQERCRVRLAQILALAGRQLTEHVTFRQLWAAISFSITAGKDQHTLERERQQDIVGLGTFPLDNLTSGRGQGRLLDAVRRFADPAQAPTPLLDEDLWSEGRPAEGRWWDRHVAEEFDPPAALWARGERSAALARFASLKRLVALCHSAGDQILDRLGAASVELPRTYGEGQLRGLVLEGIRRSYLVASEEVAAPGWLTEGLPLWISNTYRNVPASERPHIAASWLAEEDLQIRYPVRAPWLDGPLGPVQDLAWLVHPPSGSALRLDPPLIAELRRSAGSEGPLAPPERVRRFLARLAGWLEAQPRHPEHPERIAVLKRPRGELVASASVHREEGIVSYA